jgi:hypothetical protein
MCSLELNTQIWPGPVKPLQQNIEIVQHFSHDGNYRIDMQMFGHGENGKFWLVPLIDVGGMLQ